MVFSSRSAPGQRYLKGAAAPRHLALLFAKFTTECATSLLQGEENLTHSSAKTHSSSRTLKALSRTCQRSPGSWCFLMNTNDMYSKNKEETTKPPRICFASRIKIKCRPCRAASFNWCVCPQLESSLGLLQCALSVALDEQYMCLHWCSQVGLNSFAEVGDQGLRGQCCMGKKGQIHTGCLSNKSYQIWTVVLVTLEIHSSTCFKAVLE